MLGCTNFIRILKSVLRLTLARILDPRMGMWFSRDPIATSYPSMSPYNSFADNPILFIDPDGRFIQECDEEQQELIRSAAEDEYEANIGFDEEGSTYFFSVEEGKERIWSEEERAMFLLVYLIINN